MRTTTKNTHNKKFLSSFFGALVILSLGLFFVTLGVIPAANAQNSGEYTLLAPLPIGASGSDTNTVTLGGEKAFQDYLNSAFKIGITIAILLAVIMIVIGGIQWMGESVFGKESGKKKITDALTGLVLALAIFLILNTINPDLVNLRLGVANLAQPPAIPAGTGVGTTLSTETMMAGLAKAAADDASARAALTAGISVNKQACPSGVRYQDVPGGCTTLTGLKQIAIDKLNQLEADCKKANPGCTIEITGGTEAGHTPTNGLGGHSGGNVVDLSLGTSVTSFIEKTGQRSDGYAGCSVGQKYIIDFTGGQINGRSVFVNESIPGNPPHWHVCL